MKYLKAFDNHEDYNDWTLGQGDTSFIRPSVGYCISENEVHFNGKISQYVDFGLPSGNLWATCNLGSDDPYMPGLYYAWGELTGYTANQVGVDKNFNDADYRFITTPSAIPDKYNDLDNYDVLLNEDDAAYTELGAIPATNQYWHIPTMFDFNELVNSVNNATYDAVHNCLVLSINGKTLVLPLSGMAYDGTIQTDEIDVGVMGSYWSSSLDVNSSNYTMAYGYKFYSGSPSDTTISRSAGMQIRPVLSPPQFVPQ